MKIAIISDTHDNLSNLEELLRQISIFKIEYIIHCGDVAEPETLEWLVNNFGGSIKLACGNMEINREEFELIAQKHKNLEVFSKLGEAQLGQFCVAFIHQLFEMGEAIKNNQFNFIFHGHTHKPWIEQAGKTIVANPGTLGGVFTFPTYAVWDSESGQLELKKLY